MLNFLIYIYEMNNGYFFFFITLNIYLYGILDVGECRGKDAGTKLWLLGYVS